MAITSVLPFEIPEFAFINGITSMIVEQRSIDTIMPVEWQDRLLLACSEGQVTNGAGIVYNFKKQLQTVEDRTTTSTRNTPRLPSGLSELITIDQAKFVATSFDVVSIREAFANDLAMHTYMSMLYDLNRETMHEHMVNALLAQINGYVPAQASQTVVVQLADTSTITDQTELHYAHMNNAQKIARSYQDAISALSVYGNKFSDNPAAYTKTNSAALSVISNNSFTNAFLTTALTSVYGSQLLAGKLPFGMVDIPGVAITDPTLIAIAYQRPKFVFVSSYRTQLSDLDPSTALETFFLHWKYAVGKFLTPPAIKLVANYTSPTPETMTALTPTKTETVVPTKTETVVPTKTETVVPTKTETVVPTK